MSSANEVMTLEEAASVLISMKSSVPRGTRDMDFDISEMMPPRKMPKLKLQCQPSGSRDFSKLSETSSAEEEYVPMSLFLKFVKRLDDVIGQKKEWEILKNNLHMLLKQNLDKNDKSGKEVVGDLVLEEVMHEEEVMKDEVEDSVEGQYASSSSETESDDDDDTRKVPIGSGRTTVPASVLKSIDWTSYTIATRTLLQTLFTRRTLATHSLTGKKSPAFADKPAKKQLNPNIVGDIVQLVSDRCGVPARLVRGCITTKCADETKMLRNSL